jgi:hypothetical protein
MYLSCPNASLRRSSSLEANSIRTRELVDGQPRVLVASVRPVSQSVSQTDGRTDGRADDAQPPVGPILACSGRRLEARSERPLQRRLGSKASQSGRSPVVVGIAEGDQKLAAEGTGWMPRRRHPDRMDERKKQQRGPSDRDLQGSKATYTHAHAHTGRRRRWRADLLMTAAV